MKTKSKIVIASLLFPVCVLAETAPDPGVPSPAPVMPEIQYSTCPGDYLFCAMDLVDMQNEYNAIVKVASNLGGDMAEAAVMDLNKRPVFQTVIECQAHTAACGYSRLEWFMRIYQAYGDLKKLIKEKVR